MAKNLTLGSLFDGIGGFPFCAELSGIMPVWAAEIEPMCVAVTKQHFPNMLHFGDVSKISGAEIPPVDIITFGSPCQDLSVAGKRKGLKHTNNGDSETTRSGLFIEAVRIIYEMRSATNGKYPTFIVWENVPGAFNSHNGRDFRTVLEEITKTDIPMPASGKWAPAGVVRGKQICAAWRQFDAQYWGVPQRRKRIYLVGSFGSDCAEEILFDRDSVQRYLAPRGTAGQGTAADSESRAGIGDFESRSVVYNGDGKTAPTVTGDHNSRVTDYSAVVLQSAGFLDRAPKDAYSIGYKKEKSHTLRAGMIPSVIVAAGFNGQNSISAASVELQSEQTPTLTTKKNTDVVYALQGKAIGRKDKDAPNGSGVNENISFTLNATDQHAVVYALDRASFNQGINAKYDFEITDSGVNSTVVSRGPSAVCYNICSDASNAMQSDNPHSGIYETETTRTLDGNGGNPACNQGGTVICQRIIEWIVRRLTPRECERLQGYPDDWTVLPKISDMSEADYLFFRDVFCIDREINGKSVKKLPTKPQTIKWYNKLDSDSRRYKALGNSLAIPCALRVIGGIAKYMEG